ncbi:hypothetical protein BASH2_04674 [Bacillus anthracis]|nr:hypothetical protein BASH2_04674 [Bacillus anthracis]
MKKEYRKIFVDFATQICIPFIHYKRVLLYV